MAIFHGIVNLLPTTALPTTTSPVVAVSHDVHCTLRSSRKKSPRTTALALYDGQNLKISNHCRQALTLKAYRLKSIVLAFFFFLSMHRSSCLIVFGSRATSFARRSLHGRSQGQFPGRSALTKSGPFGASVFLFLPWGAR